MGHATVSLRPARASLSSALTNSIRVPMASAAAKSAVLLAGLNSAGAARAGDDRRLSGPGDCREFRQGRNPDAGPGVRVKRSGRLAALARGLENNGVDRTEGPDWLSLRGWPDGRGFGAGSRDAIVATGLDLHITMSFLVMGLASEHPISIDDGSAIATGFPEFITMMTGLGAEMTQT